MGSAGLGIIPKKTAFFYCFPNVHGLKVCPKSGNEKLGAKKEPDPDPTPYLFLTYDMKR